jgi:hypothetical protein
MRHLLVVLAAAAATVTPTSTFPKGPISPRASHEIVRLDAVASTLAGRAVTVNCWSSRDWNALVRNAVQNGEGAYADAAAFANIDRHQIQIGPGTCEILAKILGGGSPRELDTATAVGVLAHEARHTAGVYAESAAECGAMRDIPRAARLLGLQAATGTRLQHVFRGMVYPLDLPRYRTPSCRAGLPGIVVRNEFGPDAHVAALRARLRVVAAALPGWRRLPVPLVPLGRCSAVRSRIHEVARVEGLYAPAGRRTSVDVAVVEFDSAAAFANARGRLAGSVRCFAAQSRRQLRRSDPTASVRVEPLQGELRGRGLRIAFRGAGVVGARVIVQDSIFVSDPRTRTLLLLAVTGRDAPPPEAVELRAYRAALG